MPDHVAGPRLLILDDEPVQRMTMHLHLAGLGAFVDFGDPRPALEYLEHHQVDAVIVDIRMPSLPVDGLWFLQELRKRDRDLGVILRTADDGVEIAQAGIESRAIQRVIKSMPDAKARLRTAVQTAVMETRERRRAGAALVDAEMTRQQLVSVLGRVECEMSVAEMCRGFVQGLTTKVATLTGYSELLCEQLSATDPTARDLLERNRDAAHALSERVTNFLSTPYLEPEASAAINGCVDALIQIFRVHPSFGAKGCRFEARGILPDAEFSANPTRLVAALRHLVEYCAHRSAPAGVIGLTVNRCPNARLAIALNKEGLVLNPRWAPGGPALLVTLQADIGHAGLEELRRDFRTCSPDPQSGNLLIVGAELVDDHLALDIVRTKKGATMFNLYLPLRA
jgi:CheY-like chemotaxis protein